MSDVLKFQFSSLFLKNIYVNIDNALTCFVQARGLSGTSNFAQNAKLQVTSRSADRQNFHIIRVTGTEQPGEIPIPG